MCHPNSSSMGYTITNYIFYMPATLVGDQDWLKGSYLSFGAGAGPMGWHTIPSWMLHSVFSPAPCTPRPPKLGNRGEVPSGREAFIGSACCVQD